MARYKVKGKDCQLKVKVKLSFKEEIDERQLDFFSSKYYFLTVPSLRRVFGI